MQQLPLCPRYKRGPGQCKAGLSCKFSHGPGNPTKGMQAYQRMLASGDLSGVLQTLPMCSVHQEKLSLRAPLTEALNAYMTEHYAGRLYDVISFFTTAHIFRFY